MGLESADYVNQLVSTNPVGSTDAASTLDDHDRLIKRTLKNSFPNIGGAMIASHTELNILYKAIISTTELNALSGVAGNIETRLDALEGGTGAVNGPASSTNDGIALWDGTSGSLLQDSGVLLSQLATTTQLATKAPINSPNLTGTPTAPTPSNGDNTTRIATTAFVQSNQTSIGVTAGTIAHGGTITPPSGYTAAECYFMVSFNFAHPDLLEGVGNEGISRIACSVNQSTGVVTCTYRHTGDAVTDQSGTANYICIGIG